MLKLSKYNEIYCSDDDYLLIFNRLSGVILKSRKDIIKKIFFDKSFKLDVKDPLICNLINDGFIVSESMDEKNVKYLRDFDAKATNELKLIIMPTYQCNFRCMYCYQNFESRIMDEAMADRLIKYVKREIHKYAGLSVGWYGGEPLLCADLIDRLSQKFIDICHSVNRKYSAAITTNGYLLDLQMFQRMLKDRISLYQVTLDGPKSIHDKNRKLVNDEGSFDTIVNNLMNISKNINTGSFKIKIRSNMQSGNLDTYGDFFRFLYDTFGKDDRFVYWFTAVSNYGGESIKKMGSLLNTFDSIYDMLLLNQYPLNYSAFYYHLTARGCIASNRNGYVVTPDCSLLKCSVGLEQSDNKIGYIAKDGEAIIDKYKLAKWIHYERDKDSRCTQCEKSDICRDFACPKVNNFPDEGIDCTYDYINSEKIIKLLCQGNYSFIKHY